MSQDFKKSLILDDRLCCTDKLEYGVVKGGQNMTPQVYQAISASPSSHTYNLQIPSEQTVIDRRVLWNSTVRLKFTTPAGANAVPVNQYPIHYGLTDALAPFPLHQLTTVQSCTVNNNTVSLNTRDVLPALMRMNDKRQLMRYNGTTPVMFDTYGKYSDAVGAINNPLGSYGNIGDNDLHPRGAFVVNAIYGGTPNAPVALPVGDGASALTFYVEFTTTEPLLVSPFIWANPQSNNMGFYGIQNMNFVFNIGDCSRVWRSANPWMASTVITVDSFSNSRLILNQLTPHPSQLLPSRNVVPYYTLPRYITQFNQIVNPAYTVNAGLVSINPSTSGTVISSTNIQLNQIPDKVIIFVRKALGSQTPNDTDSFLAIRGISINFNNQSGILSTATPYDLYRYSVNAGSNQSFDEFYGLANRVGVAGLEPVPTTGSLLCLDFAEAIQLNDDFYASGSLGNFQFQFNLSCVNQFNSQDANWELVLITVNSGLFVCERGTSSSYTGILTRQDVLDVSTQEPTSSASVRRMIGGGFLDTLKSVAGKVHKHLPALAGVAKHGLSMIDNPKAQAVSKAIGSMGYGRSGGGMSGGRRHKLEDKLM